MRASVRIEWVLGGSIHMDGASASRRIIPIGERYAQAQEIWPTE